MQNLYLKIPIPGKGCAEMQIPIDLDLEDVELVKDILNIYITRRNKQPRGPSDAENN